VETKHRRIQVSAALTVTLDAIIIIFHYAEWQHKKKHETHGSKKQET